MAEKSIVVLPFVNMSSDPENEYFSDGITVEIINALARIEGVKAISRTSSFFFKGKSVPISEIAKQLNVSVVLEGSVRVSGNTVRVNAQMIDAENDFQFWSEVWDRKLDNIFEIQDEISLHIADKLREQIGHFEIQPHLVSQQTRQIDAYTLSLKASYHFNKWNPEDVKISIELFEKALEIDPTHTESYVGLADAYGFLATTEFMPRGEAWMRSAELTKKAFEIDPENAGVHYQLANLSFFVECNFTEAFRHAMKATELKPGYPEARQFVAFLYVLSGDSERAKAHLDIALALDPLNQETLFYKAYYLYRTESWDEALEQLDALLEGNPRNIPAFVVRMYCLFHLGRHEEVLKILDNIPDEINIPDERLGLQCLAHIFLNREEEWKDELNRLIEASGKRDAFQAHSYLFLVYANLGWNDKAFEWLEESLNMKSSIFLLSYTDPLVNDLKNDARYAKFHKTLYPLTPQAPHKQSKKQVLLTDETADAYLEKLERFISEESPYLNPNLTLRSLADQMEIHPNHLSWLLNERKGRNFNEFVNQLRVEHFKQLAADPSNQHISLVGLAYESGFNSKTVFNTFFKREVGMTPSAYLKSISSAK